MERVLLWAAVGALGGLGALARVGVGAAVARRRRDAVVAGTFVVNVSGAFALGVLSGASVHGDALLLAGTATLGSYTTFSTWMLESRRLADAGARRTAALNLVVSLAAGLAALVLGRALGAAL
jgi:CrcB protein